MRELEEPKIAGLIYGSSHLPIILAFSRSLGIPVIAESRRVTFDKEASAPSTIRHKTGIFENTCDNISQIAVFTQIKSDDDCNPQILLI